MNFEHRLELLIGGLLNHVVPAVAGIVHDDIDRIKFGDRSLDDPLRDRRIGQVAGDVAYPARLRQLGFGLQQHGLIEVVDHHPRTGSDQPLRYGSSDASAGSGHQRRFSFQREWHFCRTFGFQCKSF